MISPSGLRRAEPKERKKCVSYRTAGPAPLPGPTSSAAIAVLHYTAMC